LGEEAQDQMQRVEIGNTENEFALDLPVELGQSIVEPTSADVTSPTSDGLTEASTQQAEEQKELSEQAKME